VVVRVESGASFVEDVRHKTFTTCDVYVGNSFNLIRPFFFKIEVLCSEATGL
jgi:hypothetical protein